MKNKSLDIAYEKLLADLKAYGAKKETEEKCRKYAEKKRREEKVGNNRATRTQSKETRSLPTPRSRR